MTDSTEIAVLRSRKYRLKRVLDICGAIFCLLLVWPLILIIALWVYIGSGTPVLHRELRLGRYGKPFILYKFRTLKTDSTNESSIAPDDDHRITRIGLPLRRTRLDELPQLYNLLAGDMSLVGPRPMVRYHAQKLKSEVSEALLSVRPGATDPASVQFFAEDAVLAGRPDAENEYIRLLLPAKAQVQLNYLRHWSLWLDIRIIVMTLARVWSPRARQESMQRVRAVLTGDSRSQLP